jgi:hypothetical protein
MRETRTASILLIVTNVDAATVLRLGGWDIRNTRVLFIAENGDLAIALLDAGSDFNLDDFERDAKGNWQAATTSGSAGDFGSGMQGRVAYTYGRARPGEAITVTYGGAEHTVTASADGWWAFVAEFDPSKPNDLPLTLND